MFSVAEASIQSQMYVRVPVHLSIIKTTQPFRILIFGHQDHWPSYLSAIMPINYHSHDHQHSCKSGTKGNRIRLLYEIYTTHNLVLYEPIIAIWYTKPIKHIHLYFTTLNLSSLILLSELPIELQKKYFLHLLHMILPLKIIILQILSLTFVGSRVWKNKEIEMTF